MRISDWSSDVCSSDLRVHRDQHVRLVARRLDVAGPEIDLKGGNAEGRALRRPDFRRKIGEGRKVVSGQRGRQGELATRQLHAVAARSEEHTSELQSLMRISYAVFCLNKKIDTK